MLRIALLGLIGCTSERLLAGDPTPTDAWRVEADALPDLSVCADGTTPFTDIQDAIDAASWGDVIDVCPGTYGPIIIEYADDLTVVGPGPDLATIDGGDDGAVIVHGGVFSLSGFSVTGTGEHDDDGLDHGGAFTSHEAELTVRDCRVFGVTGAYAVAFDEDVLVMEDVVWEDNAPAKLWYLYQGDLAAIRRNTVRGGLTEHIAFTERLHELELTGTVFHGVDIDSGHSAFALATDGDGPFTMANNVFYDVDDTSPWGGRTFDFPSSIAYDFRNNVVAGSDSWDPREIDAGFSLFHDNGVDYEEVADGDGNLFEVDPLFVDPASGDFHLRPGSPAIDAGDPDDLDADGTRADLGAYGAYGE